ncbi:MAG: ABC transporter ATP-binding protein [Acetobacteraceae bacterium]|nr:ABC transporter ATP-binding protein [Acetobacteraceae bacterium]
MSRPALEIAGYSLRYRTAAGPFDALKSIELSIPRGRTLGLVGESGSGKTSLAWAIMRYLPANAEELAGSILLAGEDLRAMTPRQILEIRGARISMVFQDPSTSLNPTMRLGDQLGEVLIRHRGLSAAAALQEGTLLLARTGIRDPAAMMRRYPHQASGGEKQRVVIATAIACNPDLIIFDEPTTALDIVTARQILDLFTTLREESGVAALYISHDLGLVSRIAHEVAVIHQGEIVERGPCSEVFRAPRQAYTRALLAAVPDPARRLALPPPDRAAAPLLDLSGVSVRYGEQSALKRLLRPGQPVVHGARNVSFDVRPGELVGIVGESGSGKSTIAKVLAGLQDFSGSVAFAGRHFARRPAFDRAYRRAVQIVFQHPDASLNPRQTVAGILSRPLKLYGTVPRDRIAARISELLARVRLPGEFAARYPHQLSGGEKQRVAIARAFAAEPRLVICDEITSSLDVSVQASVAELLIALQRETGTACLFITHDLNLVRQLAHRIAVMQHGLLVDLFATEEAMLPARDPYTRTLLDAVPTLAGTDNGATP